MERFPIAYLEFKTLSHATENLEKVYRALENVATSQLLRENPLQRQRLKGHYGNPITLLTVKTRSKPLIRQALANIFSRLTSSDRVKLLEELEGRVDAEGSFYLRLSKQEAYLGRLKLEEADPIRVRIKLALPSKHRGRLLEACRSMVEEASKP